MPENSTPETPAMKAVSPFAIKWGILATGGIAQTFVKDLLNNPATRGVPDIQHIVAAAASSNSLSRASEFLTSVGAPSTARPYGSYSELVADPAVDIIYVATPHSHHFQNTMLCLLAGKHVLCEKAFTVNAEQARILIATAKAKKLFLMEAVWTRFFPLSIQIRNLVKSGAIGDVHRVIADFSVGDGLTFGDEHRMVNMNLAGGSLLDLGIYALTWNFQILYHCQAGDQREKPKVLAVLNPYAGTGADENTGILLQFPKNRSIGVAMCSLLVETDPGLGSTDGSAPAVRIQGSKGEIQVFFPTYRPEHYNVITKREGKTEVQDVVMKIPRDAERNDWGQGMFWEADESARCIRDGKLESDTMGWDESLLIMEVMDEVRRQGGIKYPDLIESAVYDANSPLNGGAVVKRTYRGDFGV